MHVDFRQVVAHNNNNGKVLLIITRETRRTFYRFYYLWLIGVIFHYFSIFFLQISRALIFFLLINGLRGRHAFMFSENKLKNNQKSK